MSEEEFVELVSRCQSSVTAKDVNLLIAHAIELRRLAKEYVNDMDAWDQDWPELGYEARRDR